MGHDPEIGVTIGYSEFYSGKNSELVRLGVNAAVDGCLARLNVEGAKRLQGFEVQNKGNGSVVLTLKKRGKEYSILAEVITGLRIGSTDKVKGPLANRRIVGGTIIITDTNVVTPQRVEDTRGDGDLYQTDGPAGPTYPVKVGTVDYRSGIIEFTFALPVTAPIQCDYHHADWTGFTTPITRTIVAGGGFCRVDMLPENSAGAADNFIDGIRDETEIGWFGKLSATTEKRTSIGLNVFHFGDDSKIVQPLSKGEFDDVPFIPKTIYIKR